MSGNAARNDNGRQIEKHLVWAGVPMSLPASAATFHLYRFQIFSDKAVASMAREFTGITTLGDKKSLLLSMGKSTRHASGTCKGGMPKKDIS